MFVLDSMQLIHKSLSLDNAQNDRSSTQLIRRFRRHPSSQCAVCQWAPLSYGYITSIRNSTATPIALPRLTTTALPHQSFKTKCMPRAGLGEKDFCVRVSRSSISQGASQPKANLLTRKWYMCVCRCTLVNQTFALRDHEWEYNECP